MTNHSTRSIEEILTEASKGNEKIVLLQKEIAELKDQLYGEGGWPYTQVYNALGLTPLGISWDDLIKKVFDLRTAEYRMANVYELQASNKKLNDIIHDRDKEISILEDDMNRNDGIIRDRNKEIEQLKARIS